MATIQASIIPGVFSGLVTSRCTPTMETVAEVINRPNEIEPWMIDPSIITPSEMRMPKRVNAYIGKSSESVAVKYHGMLGTMRTAIQRPHSGHLWVRPKSMSLRL